MNGVDDDVTQAAALARAAKDRTDLLVAALRDLDDRDFAAPSELPGWDRLTIACHLRYGCRAILRMTRDAVAGRETSYYPEGRDRQRPTTLRPSPGERAADVLDDWASAAQALDEEWVAISDSGWATEVVEPVGNPDLGTIPLARLALARLTEVEVHGTDLGIGLPDWSETLVAAALPVRLRWLATRRTNHREFDRAIRGSWRLASDDGFGWTVSVDGELVESAPSANTGRAPSATIRASRRDLLALLLGRPPVGPVSVAGDVPFGEAFPRSFPGP